MEPITMTREEIIELINQYIYTNGFQRITAAQLNEILIEMANSFAIEGGLDAVLETGSTVSANREITNEDGGAFKLSAERLLGEDLYKYIGMIFQDGLTEGGAYIGKTMSSIGNRMLPKEKEATSSASSSGLLQAITIYNLFNQPEEEEDSEESGSKANGFAALRGDPIPEGIASLVNGDQFNASQWIGSRGILCNVEVTGDRATGTGQFNITGGTASIYVSSGAENAQMNIQSGELSNTVTLNEESTTFSQNYLEISSTVLNGPQSSSHVQSLTEFDWTDQDGSIMIANNDGLTLAQGKKLGLTSGGEIPTSGRATLAGGSASVATTAVKSNSVISLTVQETGTFAGNIRVSAKTPDSGFVISSTQDTDTCEVFWQIIDL